MFVSVCGMCVLVSVCGCYFFFVIQTMCVVGGYDNVCVFDFWDVVCTSIITNNTSALTHHCLFVNNGGHLDLTSWQPQTIINSNEGYAWIACYVIELIVINCTN